MKLLNTPPEALVRADESRLAGKSEKLSTSVCRVGCTGEFCGEFYEKAPWGKLWVLNQAPSSGTLRDCCWSEDQQLGRGVGCVVKEGKSMLDSSRHPWMLSDCDGSPGVMVSTFLLPSKYYAKSSFDQL